MARLEDIPCYHPHSQVALNPSFALYGNDVFFNLGGAHRSSTPTLTLNASEVSLFQRLAAQPCLASLLLEFPQATDLLCQWWQRELVFFYLPIPAEQQEHIVVLEPHVDDAALSVGGSLLKLQHAKKITILTNAFHSNYTCYHEKTTDDTEFVTQRRAAEGALAAAILGGRHEHLDQLDKPLRWTKGNGQDLLHPQQLRELAQVMAQKILALEPTELWIPLASGSHSDHHNTRNAAILMLQLYADDFANCRVSIYEDQPYVYDFGPAMRDFLLAQVCQTTRPIQVIENIDSVMAKKQRLVSIFSSQFKPSFMLPSIIAAAKDHAANAEFIERRWLLTSTPQLPSYQQFESLSDATKLFHQLKQSQEVNLVIHDYLVAEDVHRLQSTFSPLKINIYTREREKDRGRAQAVHSDNIKLHFYDNSLDDCFAVTEQLINGSQHFTILACYQLAQRECEQRFAIFNQPEQIYKTLWMSSMIAALDEQLATCRADMSLAMV
ncbi:PIG-L family deacetylase [Motilimonas sp. 1_MG-2023]|uniref:PIG-L deacetylase family protein n=1 Tax=Motilimonas sp. 1_MG-2023 TaxID=3062672 RepID=UPI0026E1F75B|nr:PIG-L family deacetylase [Motilimonas sp. 1_MG-2023]MDO6525356.1 PIG-L family deacetylase [Motilimonas sp. 1_MG-2023]